MLHGVYAGPHDVYVRNGVVGGSKGRFIMRTSIVIDGFSLLHSDRDFDAFHQHLSLRVVDCRA